MTGEYVVSVVVSPRQLFDRDNVTENPIGCPVSRPRIPIGQFETFTSSFGITGSCEIVMV